MNRYGLTLLLMSSANDLWNIVAMLAGSVALIGMMYLFYDKGRRDERFDIRYKCEDCGDFKHDTDDSICRDCRRKLNGEMAQ